MTRSSSVRGAPAHQPSLSTVGVVPPNEGIVSMSSKLTIGRIRPLARTFMGALLGASALISSSAFAQEAASPSQNATVNLIRALVQKGVLSQGEADDMITQAEAEAAQARATAQVAQSAVAASSPASAQQGTSVRYVPQFVRDEIKDEVRAEVLADAKAQGLVAPDAMPDWVRRIKISGDLRVRSESRFFDDQNYDGFINGQLINAGDPYDFNDPISVPPPILNSTKDRQNRLRVRARLGITAEVDPRVTGYLRIATGDDNSPVSTNSTLGGFFSKKDLWLDRAYVDLRPIEGSHILLGRMKNPFTEGDQAWEEDNNLIWDADINLDGVALRYRANKLASGLSLGATVGAFPISYIDNDEPLPAFSNGKVDSREDVWLYAAQATASYDFTPAVNLGLSATYYRYENLEGQLSACYANAPFCLTDYRRPEFSQRGNTLMYLRNIVPNPGDPTDISNPQYFGIASKFEVLDISARLGWRINDRLVMGLSGTYAKNLAYDEAEIFARAGGQDNVASNNDLCSVALENGFCPAGKSVFQSGDTAWMVRATIGTPEIKRWGDWNFSASYRHVEADALVDAFTDSDFRLGGTNSKGWIVGGSFGLFNNTALSARWMNAQEIKGLPFATDLLQVDLNVKF